MQHLKIYLQYKVWNESEKDWQNLLLALNCGLADLLFWGLACLINTESVTCICVADVNKQNGGLWDMLEKRKVTEDYWVISW